MLRANKFEIAAKVYGISDPLSKSDRFWSATKVNITKLISRSRLEASRQLTPNDDQIVWFSYNSLADSWELFTINGQKHNDLLH